MGRGTYYSPFIVGILFALLAKDLFDDAIAPEPRWQYWSIITGVAIIFGVICQVCMLGVQGMFGQVLPVPGGRSIRGRGARAGGGLTLLAVALGAVTALLQWEAVNLAPMITGALAAAALAIAAIIYIWNWPTAARDFDLTERD